MRLWTIKEICEITGFSRWKVLRAIKNEELESRKIKGSRRVMHEWLVAWLGFDPMQGASITIEKTITKTGSTVHSKTRIERQDQHKLFDL